MASSSTRSNPMIGSSSSSNIPIEDLESEIQQGVFHSTMRPMPRANSNITNSSKKGHIVQSTHRSDGRRLQGSNAIEGNGGGLTFSEETTGDSPAAAAEFAVLRSILVRENYLSRLVSVVRTIGRKFKPEVSDILDSIRISSLDVVESIQKWQNIVEKVHGEKDASFVWNGLHYLQKMSSDLDFLADYLAVQRWMGFPLQRNPFCVPFAMEAGLNHAEELVNPMSLHYENENNENSDEMIGKSPRKQITEGVTIGGSTNRISLTGQIVPQTTRSNNKRRTNSSISPYGTLPLTGRSQITPVQHEAKSGQSFIFNSDMLRIRRAEAVIMKAEAKYGVLSRDPYGRLVLRMQAMTRKAAVELAKDEGRPLTEPAHTVQYAPHAERAGVGFADVAWSPDVDAVPEGLKSRFVSIVDESLDAEKRGSGKSGGDLAPLSTKSGEGQFRRPIKASIATALDFKRDRRTKSLSTRMAEIQTLRQELTSASQQLFALSTAPNNEKGTSVGAEEIASRLEVIRSALSNQMAGVSSKHSKIAPPPPFVPGTTVILDPSHTPQNFLDGSEYNGASAVPLKPLTAPSSGLGNTDSTMVGGTQGDLSSLLGTATSLQHGSKSRKFQALMSRSQSALQSGRKRFDNELRGGDKLPPMNSSTADSVEFNEAVNAQKEALSSYIETAIKDVNVQESQVEREMYYLQRDESLIASLKKIERQGRNREHSRVIERKRRLLRPDQGILTGPSGHDEIVNVYDYYATRLQCAIRGWLVRCWVRWYREISSQAALLIQSVMRGWFGRMRVRKMTLHNHAATIIQKNFRGWTSRGTSSTMAKKQSLVKKAVTIQKQWRGILGRRRAESKRALDKAAKEAFDAVDARSLVVADVRELAKRISYAIEEPDTTSYPPDEVLMLIRLCVMVIQSIRGALGLTEYSFINIRLFVENSLQDAGAFTWKHAAQILNRSTRFIRLIRAIAFGPGAKPPRIIHWSSEAKLIYVAQTENPRWCLSTFESIGLGSRICVQLFKWLSWMAEISNRQQDFISLLASSFPDWLPNLIEVQQQSRKYECLLQVHQKVLDVLNTSLGTDYIHDDDDNTTVTNGELDGDESKLEDIGDENAGNCLTHRSHQSKASFQDEDSRFQTLLIHEIKNIKNLHRDTKSKLNTFMKQASKLRNDQFSREVYAMEAMDKRLIEERETLDILIEQFKSVSSGETVHRSANDYVPVSLSDLRHQLTNQRLKVSELESQRKVLVMEIETNRTKHNDIPLLSSNLIKKINLEGESRAALILATIRRKVLFSTLGIDDIEHVPIHLLENAKRLISEEDEARTIWRNCQLSVDEEREKLENELKIQFDEQDNKEHFTKDQLEPTELELEEERIENENEARKERSKHIQFIPDHVLFHTNHQYQDNIQQIKSRIRDSRPVLLCLSRDLSSNSIEWLIQSIRQSLPGNFVFIDSAQKLEKEDELKKKSSSSTTTIATIKNSSRNPINSVSIFDSTKQFRSDLGITNEMNERIQSSYNSLNSSSNSTEALNHRLPKQFGFDLAALQAVFDANQNAIIRVDHGLTRATRDSFLNILQLTVSALMPQPIVILVVGDERNPRQDLQLTPHSGCSADDLRLFRDAPLKITSEWISWLELQLLVPRIRHTCQLVASELVARSPSFSIVVEALFVLVTGRETLKNGVNGLSSSDRNFLHSMVWQRARTLLIDSCQLVDQLRQIRRGSLSLAAINLLEQYLAHPSWPSLSIPTSENLDDVARSPVETSVYGHACSSNAFVGKKSPYAGSGLGTGLGERGSTASANSMGNPPADGSLDSWLRWNEGLESALRSPDTLWHRSSEDRLLHILASYVEQLLRRERLCHAGNGVPLQALAKSSIRGIHAVITVLDPVDPSFGYGDTSDVTPGTSVSVASPSAVAESLAASMSNVKIGPGLDTVKPSLHGVGGAAGSRMHIEPEHQPWTLQQRRDAQFIAQQKGGLMLSDSHVAQNASTGTDAFGKPLSTNSSLNGGSYHSGSLPVSRPLLPSGLLPLPSTYYQSGITPQKALPLILRAVLTDRRVHKVVKRIEGVPHAVSVYREGGQLFFEAYEPRSAEIYLCVVRLEEIPALLVPNGTEISAAGGSGNIRPPSTPDEMYIQLIDLLRFETPREALHLPSTLAGRRQRGANNKSSMSATLTREMASSTMPLTGAQTANILLEEDLSTVKGPVSEVQEETISAVGSHGLPTLPTLTKTLICRRKLNFLQKQICKVSGYHAILSTFEASCGELHLRLYIPELSATLEATLDLEDRRELLKYESYVSSQPQAVILRYAGMEGEPPEIENLEIPTGSSVLEEKSHSMGSSLEKDESVPIEKDQSPGVMMVPRHLIDWLSLAEKLACTEQRDARPLVPFLLDRLHISPPRSVLQAWTREVYSFSNSPSTTNSVNNTMFRSKAFKQQLPGQQSRSMSLTPNQIAKSSSGPSFDMSHQTTPATAHRLDVIRKDVFFSASPHTQGLTLRIKTRGQPGKRLHRCIRRWFGVLFAVEIRVSSLTRHIEVHAYEPRLCRTWRLVIKNSFARVFLKNCELFTNGRKEYTSRSTKNEGDWNPAIDNPLAWREALWKRLRFSWYGAGTLEFDTTLARRVAMVGKRRLLLTLTLEDEFGATPDLITDPLTAPGFSNSMVSKESSGSVTSFFTPSMLRPSVIAAVENSGAGGVAGSCGVSVCPNFASLGATLDSIDRCYIRLRLMDFTTSTTHVVTLTWADILLLLRFKPNSDFVSSNSSNTRRGAEAVHNLRDETYAINVSLDPQKLAGIDTLYTFVSSPTVIDSFLSLVSRYISPEKFGGQGFHFSNCPLSYTFTRLSTRQTSTTAESALSSDPNAANSVNISDGNADTLNFGLRTMAAERERQIAEALTKETLENCYRRRTQLPRLDMEAELNELAVRRHAAMEASRLADIKAAELLAQQLLSAHLHNNDDNMEQQFGEGWTIPTHDEHGLELDPELAAESWLENQVSSCMEAMLDAIDERFAPTLLEREIPGTRFAEYQAAEAERAEAKEAEAKNKSDEVEKNESIAPSVPSNQWQRVAELGVKVTFRENKITWQGHCSVRIDADRCWSATHGPGRRFLFTVYDPACGETFEGYIRDPRHLREVLGLHGQDLIGEDRLQEMLVFVCRYRMELVVNSGDSLAEFLEESAHAEKSKMLQITESGEGASESKLLDGEASKVQNTEEKVVPFKRRRYRVQFQSERLFEAASLVTPINANTEEDTLANDRRLLDISNSRGKKLIRLVRRVSGQLMQLTYFELPQSIAEAALEKNPIRPVDSNGNVLNDPEHRDVQNLELILKRNPPPALRIVGYDPRSKRKVTLAVEPQAVVEVVGGLFSPYLAPNMRRVLAGVVADALILYYPPGETNFELMLPWSGSQQQQASIALSSKQRVTDGSGIGGLGSVANQRLPTDRHHQRVGRLFRSVLKVGKYELIVSIFPLHPPNRSNKVSKDSTIDPKTGDVIESNSETELFTSKTATDPDAVSTSTITYRNPNDLVFNFYSPAIGSSTDLVVEEAAQIERISRPILSFMEGSVRFAAIRHFATFLRSEIVEDISDSKLRKLDVVLLPPNKGYLHDYTEVSSPHPGEDLRPVGIPNVFFPVDTVGKPLSKCGMAVPNYHLPNPNGSDHTDVDFLVSVYTKSHAESPERGLVLRLYQRTSCETSILHIGPSELYRITCDAGEPDLLNQLVSAQLLESAESVDSLEAKFSDFTRKGELSKRVAKLVEVLISYVLAELAIQPSPQNTTLPYLRKKDGSAVLPQ